jgi:hypothetical protein
MEESKVYMNLLKNVERNKYKLIKQLIEKGEELSKLEPEFVPFYARDCFMKVSARMLEEAENKEK